MFTDVRFILSHMDKDHINILPPIFKMCLKERKTIAGIWVGTGFPRTKVVAQEKDADQVLKKVMEISDQVLRQKTKKIIINSIYKNMEKILQSFLRLKKEFEENRLKTFRKHLQRSFEQRENKQWEYQQQKNNQWEEACILKLKQEVMQGVKKDIFEEIRQLNLCFLRKNIDSVVKIMEKTIFKEMESFLDTLIEKLGFTFLPIVNGVSHPNPILIRNVATIAFLMPNDAYAIKDNNDASLVTKLTYEGKSILFTGDAPGKLFNSIVSNLGQEVQLLISDILICPHHGSMSENSYRWRGELDHSNTISIISSNPIRGAQKLPERSFMDYTPVVGLQCTPHIIAYHSQLLNRCNFKNTLAPLFITACSGIPFNVDNRNISDRIINLYKGKSLGYHVNINGNGTINIKAMFVDSNNLLRENLIEIIGNIQSPFSTPQEKQLKNDAEFLD
jgi:hypothetical protein